MKKIALAIVTTLLITCCEKEEIWPFFDLWKGPQNYGQVQAMRGGEDWEASAYATFFIKERPYQFGVSFLAFYPDSILSIVAESFSISNIPAAVGVYQIDNTADLPGPWEGKLRSLFSIKHDDVVITDYRPGPRVESNRVWVDAIDTVVGTVRGRFDVTLLKDPNDTRTKFPRTVRFKNGVFTARHWP